MNNVRGGSVPGDGMLTHERWGPDPPPPPHWPPVDLPLFVMSTIATVTPNLRPGYDRNKKSLSNRRERECAIFSSGRGWSYEQNQSQQGRRSCSKRLQVADRTRTVLHGRTTNCVWSHHQSCVIVCQAVARSVVRAIASCPDWLYDQSALLPTSEWLWSWH